MYRFYVVVLAGCGLLLSALPGQAAKLPTLEEVRELQSKFRAERDQVVKDGTAKRFLGELLERADTMGRKGDAALSEGRLAQAQEAFRQARWQLPYQDRQVPDHVARIFGSLRLRHSRGINSVALSPDGRRLATAGADALVKVWDLDNGRELVSYAGHGEAAYVRHALFTPDGKSVVSASAEKEIKIWDAATGKESAHLQVPGHGVSALVLSPDGKFLVAGVAPAPGGAAAQNQGSVCVYELPSGKLRRTDNDFRGRITALAFNSAGTLLAAGEETGSVRLWQFPKMIEDATLPAYWQQQDPNNAPNALVFSPDGQFLVRCGQVDIKFYAVAQPGATFQPAAPKRSIATATPQHCAAFTKDGKILFAGGGDGIIRYWDTESVQKLGELRGHNGMVWGLALHPDDNLVVSASALDYAARLWDFDIVQQARDLAGHTGAVWMAAFSPDGRKVVSAGADRSIKVWDAASGKAVLDLGSQPAPVTVALFSPDGKAIASGGGDKLVHVWDAQSGKLLATGTGHQATVTALDFSADGKRIVSGSADRSIRIWDAATGRQELALENHPSVIAAIAFPPDGKKIAVGSVDRTITIYETATGKQLERIQAHGDAVTSLAYSPDGQFLASGSADGSVHVWLTGSPGSPLVRVAAHDGPVSMVSFRKDNQHLVTAGSDQLVKLWKIEGTSAKELQTYRGHKDWVTSASFSRDGFHVVSASVDKLVKIWEITSRELPTQPEHASAVESVAISPDNKLLATGSADNTIKIWERATGAEVATLTGHSQQVVSLTFSPDSKLLVSSGYEGALRLWEMAPPRELARTQAQLQNFSQLPRYSPYVFMGPEAKKLFVWLPALEGKGPTKVVCFNVEDGRELFNFNDANRTVNSLAFCANGKLAATGAKEGTVRLFDLEKQGMMLPGGDWFFFDKASVADLALTPDSKTLVVTNEEGEIHIADVVTRQVRKKLKGHEGKIMACITSPDGKRCATLGLDNIVKVWDLGSGAELRHWVLGRPTAESPGLVVSGLAFTPDGRQLATANTNTTAYLLDLP